LAFVLAMPAVEFDQGLTIIAERVNRRAAVRRVEDCSARSRRSGGSQRLHSHRATDTSATPAGFGVDEEDARVLAEDDTT